MKIADYIFMALSNLRKKKFRTFLTVFSVSIGVVLIIIAVGASTGLQKMIENEVYKQDMTSVEVIKMDSGEMDGYKETKEQNKITKDKIKKIKAVKNVKEVTVRMSENSLGVIINDQKFKKKVRITGVDTELSDAFVFQNKIDSVIKNKKDAKESTDVQPLKYGRFPQKGENNTAVINESYLDKIGVTNQKDLIGKEFELKGMNSIGDYEIAPSTKLKLVGITSKDFADDQIIVPINVTAKMRQYYLGVNDYYEKEGADFVSVSAKSYADVKQVSKDIGSIGNFMVSNAETSLQRVKISFSVIKIVSIIFGSIVMFVSAMGVINTMTMSVYERTRAIGIMRATGASRKNIRRLFITETSLIGLFGALAGIGVSFVVGICVNMGVHNYLVKQGAKMGSDIISFPLWLVAGVIMFSIIIALFAGLIPAIRAARMNPVDALKGK